MVSSMPDADAASRASSTPAPAAPSTPSCFPILPPPSLCPARPSPVVPSSATRPAPALAAEGAMSEPPVHHWS
ncbi:unnamed protein product [Ectocarpus sp. 4 AP-2014]